MNRAKFLWAVCSLGLIFSMWLLQGRTSPTQEPGGRGPQLDVRDFVRQTFIHGVPYEEASRYGSNATPVLLEMLSDPKEKTSWANIVVTLGIIGDEAAVAPLVRFFTDEERELSDSEYAAKSSVLISLGYLINKSKSEKALSFLKESLDPSVWAHRNVRWAGPHFASTEDRDEQLSTMAILGLALSGQPSAREAIERLREPAPTEAAKRFRAKVKDVVDLALRDHEAISKEGLQGYYRKGHIPQGPSGKAPSEAEKPFVPSDLVTGAERPPQIITGYPAVPPLPQPAAKRPSAPPKPAYASPPRPPKPSLLGPPPIQEDSRPPGS